MQSKEFVLVCAVGCLPLAGAVAVPITGGDMPRTPPESFQIMTPAESEEHRAKMATLVGEARERYRNEQYRRLRERARAQGYELPQTPPWGRTDLLPSRVQQDPVEPATTSTALSADRQGADQPAWVPGEINLAIDLTDQVHAALLYRGLVAADAEKRTNVVSQEAPDVGGTGAPDQPNRVVAQIDQPTPAEHPCVELPASLSSDGRSAAGTEVSAVGQQRSDPVPINGGTRIGPETIEQSTFAEPGYRRAMQLRIDRAIEAMGQTRGSQRSYRRWPLPMHYSGSWLGPYPVYRWPRCR